MSSLRLTVRAAVVCTVLGTALAACSEPPRSNAAEVSGHDRRRLPPDRLGKVPDIMIAASDKGRTLGSDSALVRMYVVSDYQCAECQRWFETTLPAIRSRYIDSGTVRLVWVHYPLREHPASVFAANAAQCAAVHGKFWEVSALLFRSRELWGESKRAAALVDSIANLRDISPFTFRNCTASERMHRQIRGDIDWADSARAGTPPMVRIGSRLLPGSASLATLQATIDSVRAGS